MRKRQGIGLQVLVGLSAAVAVALAVGVPSAMVANPFFSRMTPAPWWSYGVWVLTAAVSGLLAATYVRRPSAVSSSPARVGLVANVGSLLAVGCPVCNKLVIAAVGVSGALNLWAPIQPLIAATSLGLLGWALWRRMRAPRSCRVGGDACSPPQTAAASASEDATQ